MQHSHYQPASHPQRHRSRKQAVIVGLLLFIGIIVAVLLTIQNVPTKKTQTNRAQSPEDTSSQSDPNSISFLATGDWIAHDSVNTAAATPDGSYNYMPLVSDFSGIFNRADIRFCNDPILNGGKALGISGYPKFNSPTEFVRDMGKIGCNLVNTASNHSFDFTQANITNSVDAWDKVPNTLAVAGENRSQTEHDTVHYFTMKGVKFAFLAYTTYVNADAPAQNAYGVNVFSKEFSASQIATAKQNGAQFIIVSMRWGTEYSAVVNAKQKSDAQYLADQGVNLVLGHGPHELQTVSELAGASGNKTLVWYSLGNFLNTQEPPETLFNGIVGMKIDAKSLKISNLNYLPIYMHYEWTPAEAAADKTNARHNLHLYPLEKATQSMINAQQLKTTVEAQRSRIQSLLSANGVNVPLVTLSQF